MIKPEDVASQFMVARTHDNQFAVQFPMKADGKLDGIEALKLITIALNFVTDTLHQEQQSRIVLVPGMPAGLPPEFLTKPK